MLKKVFVVLLKNLMAFVSFSLEYAKKLRKNSDLLILSLTDQKRSQNQMLFFKRASCNI